MKKSIVIILVTMMLILATASYCNFAYAAGFNYTDMEMDHEGNLWGIRVEKSGSYYYPKLYKNDVFVMDIGDRYSSNVYGGMKIIDHENFQIIIGTRQYKFNFLSNELVYEKTATSEQLRVLREETSVTYDFNGNRLDISNRAVNYLGEAYRIRVDVGSDDYNGGGYLGIDGNYYFTGIYSKDDKDGDTHRYYSLYKFDTTSKEISVLVDRRGFTWDGSVMPGAVRNDFFINSYGSWSSYRVEYHSYKLVNSGGYIIPDVRDGYFRIKFGNNITGNIYYNEVGSATSTLAGSITNASTFSFKAPDNTKQYNIYVMYNDKIIWRFNKVKPSQNGINLTQSNGALSWSNDIIDRGRGYINVSWSPITHATGYKFWVFDGYQYRAFDVGSATSWDSRTWKIWPNMTWLNGQDNNSITSDVFNRLKGGGDLPDNPNLLYKKTSGTAYDNNTNYWFKVSAYNANGESDLCDAITVTLPNRTDTDKPTGSMSIQNGASAVNSVNVALNLSATDTGGSGVSKMRFSNDNSVWSAWENYSAAKTWTLTSGSGTKTVYAQFMDNAGNISLTYTDDIILDVTPPTGSITINSDAEYSTTRTLQLTLPASDNIQVAKMAFKVDNEAWQTPVVYASPYTLTISAGNGTRTVYVKFIDSAGNESGAYSDTIILDETAPIINSFNINNGAEWAGDGGVNLNIDATDEGTGISEMQFSNDGSTWSGWESFAGIRNGWQVTPGNGIKTIHARIRDKAGNISSISSSTIKVDAVKPTGTVIINDGATKVGTINVKVRVTASDDYSGIDRLAFSKDGVTWGEWVHYDPEVYYDFQLEGGTGNRYCYLRIRDKAGNISDSVRTDIYLKDDNEAPKIEMKINNGAEYTLDVNVMLTINVFDDLTPIENLKMRFSSDGTSWTAWEQVAFIKNWTLSNVKGMQRVFMQASDDAGNIATTGASIHYYERLEDFMDERRGRDIDTEAPIIKSFKIASGASIITSSSIPLSIVAQDNNGVEGLTMCFSDDGNSWTAPVTFANRYTLNKSLSPGYRTIYVRITDRAGNSTVGELQFFVK